MITYRDKYVRPSFLKSVRRIAEEEGDARVRYAYIIGAVEALLEDDTEVVRAIEAAFRGPQEKAKALARAGKAA